MKQAIEVERKWLLKELPDFNTHKPVHTHEITQDYLAIGRMRLRKKDKTHLLTYKSKGNISRQEWEEAIPAWVYQDLLQHSTARLQKTRYILNDAGQTLELDVYHGNLAGLITIEAEWVIEFDEDLGETDQQNRIASAEKTAYDYNLPEWISEAVDVTTNGRYSNRDLAIHGIPDH